MSRNKASLSQGKTYKEIGEFWDDHDLGEFWDKTKSADFDVDLASEVTYYSLDKAISEKIQEIAQKRGISADTLVNLWLQEKLQSEMK